MKRSGFPKTPAATTGLLRVQAQQRIAKVRKCKVCRINPVIKFGAVVCSTECAVALVVSTKLKAERAKAKAVRVIDSARKDAIKTRSDWIKEVQTAFNAFIRARDADQPCICCGKPFEPAKFGGSMDAGHYLSRGSASHLRFDERNVHGQRKNCNRPGGTTREAFRKGMEARIGLAALEALESDQESRDWTIDDLRAIKATYRSKLKELKDAA